MLRPPAPVLVLTSFALLPGLGCASKSEGDAQGTGGPPPATVSLGEVRGGGLEVEWRLLGQVRSEAHAQLAAGASGEVLRVEVREGDRVTRGTLLVEIDRALVAAQAEAQAAEVRRAREQLEQARRDSRRREAAGSEAVAAAEIEQAASQAAALEAEAARLTAEARRVRAELGRHRVVAPFDGVIAARSVDPGDWVEPGNAVLGLVAEDRVEVLVAAPPELVRGIEAGDRTRLERGHDSAEAEVRGIVRALDPVTRTAKVRLAPTGDSPWLLAGSTADVVFRLRREEPGTVVVPRDALVRGAVGSRVVRPKDGQAEHIDVEIVATATTEALVKAEGLAPGDRVVVRGNERLRPGQPLAVEDE